jgi:hypothetical protein
MEVEVGVIIMSNNREGAAALLKGVTQNGSGDPPASTITVSPGSGRYRWLISIGRGTYVKSFQLTSQELAGLVQGVTASLAPAERTALATIITEARGG